MKKLLSLLLAVAMLFGSVSVISVFPNNSLGVVTHAAAHTKIRYMSTFDKTGYIATGSADFLGRLDGDIVIESVHEGKPVVAIGFSAFADKKKITSVSIPASVKKIGANAFKNCSGLTTVTMAEGVEIIGDSAFSNCTSASNITIPKSVKSIGDFGFEQCPIASVDLSRNNDFEKLGNNAFFMCGSLNQIQLPNKAIVIGQDAFVSSGYYNNSKNWDNGALYVDNHLVNVNVNLTGTFKVKTIGVKTVADGAFKNCSSLTEVKLKGSIFGSSSVERIGNNAFTGCTALARVELADSISDIGRNAFTDTAIYKDQSKWANGVFRINNHIIASKPLDVPANYVVESNIKTIASDAFKGCIKLQTISIPQGVTTLGDSAFDGCYSLKSINLPKSVFRIGDGAFNGASVLTAINVDANCVRYSSENGVLFAKAKLILIKYPEGKADKSYQVPKSVISIDQFAFNNCSKLQEVTILKNVKNIEETAFDGHNRNLVIIGEAGSCAEGFAADKKITFKAYGGQHIHSWDNGTVTKEPTCTSEGIKTYKCTECGQTKTEKIVALGHSWDNGKITKEPTCTQSGIKTYTCTRCHQTKTETVPSKGGHKFGLWTTVTSATCEKEGLEERKCLVCGEKETRVIPKKAHSFGPWEQTKAPTCTENGAETRKCTNCGKVETRVIKALGHKFDSNGVCTVCGVKQSLATPKMVRLSNIVGGIQVVWNEVPNAKEYIVYKRGPGESNWSVVGKTNGETSFFDKDVVTGNFYRYTVEAVNDENCSGREEGIYTRYVATPHMKKLSNVLGGVKVEWNKVPGATEYRVYRRAGGGSWTYLDTVKGENTISYLDKTAKTGIYWRYTVRAVQMGRYSHFESGIYTKYVATPHMKKLTNLSNGIKVEWNKVPGADEYRIYRRSAGNNWTYLGTVKGENTTYFIDKKATRGTYWRYTVRAVDSGRYSSSEEGIYIKR